MTPIQLSAEWRVTDDGTSWQLEHWEHRPGYGEADGHKPKWKPCYYAVAKQGLMRLIRDLRILPDPDAMEAVKALPVYHEFREQLGDRTPISGSNVRYLNNRGEPIEAPTAEVIVPGSRKAKRLAKEAARNDDGPDRAA